MKVLLIGALCAVQPFLATVIRAQSQPSSPPPEVKSTDQSLDEGREIWDTGFIKKRPAPSHPRHPQGPIHYMPDTHNHDSPPHGEPSQAALGLTIWRLRPQIAGDREGARLLVQDGGKSGDLLDLIPERMDSSTPLQDGERIRLSVEVPRSGYLYVIDLERYRDGTTGDPFLIFPTLSMNRGKNEVQPGMVIEIPPQNASVRCLRVTRSSDHQIGEDLTLLVTPQPLTDVVPTDGAQRLDPARVAGWDRDWSINDHALNLEGGAHTVWSEAEQRAGASMGSALLTQGDPPPQTILAVPVQSVSRPLLVHLTLNIE